MPSGESTNAFEGFLLSLKNTLEGPVVWFKGLCVDCSTKLFFSSRCRVALMKPITMKLTVQSMAIIGQIQSIVNRSNIVAWPAHISTISIA